MSRPIPAPKVWATDVKAAQRLWAAVVLSPRVEVCEALLAGLFKGERIPCDAGPALRVIEDFTDRYENIAISGPNYKMFGVRDLAPFFVSTHVYSALLIRTDLPERWRGKYNEDNDLCLQVLGAGWNTVLVNAFLIDKVTTMTQKGGNTDELYAGNGRSEMAESLAREWPGIASVGTRWQRPQGIVDWKRLKQPLVPRQGICIDGNNEYGLRLEAVSPPQSSQIRRLLEDAESAA